MSRRSFLLAGASLVLGPAMAGCGTDPTRPAQESENRRLSARPGAPSLSPDLGESVLGLGDGRDGLLFVPADYDPQTPAPLLVFLHGATGSSAGARSLGTLADDRGVVVLIPESRGVTWDRIRGRFGPDVAFIDQALEHTFARCAIDGTRVALAGFSDGATYALSLGVSNGDLFTHLIGFSPGGIERQEPVGMPEVFVSHGRSDPILPLGASRDNVVPALRQWGYSVEYVEFDGGHVVPAEVARAATDWWLG